jgi:hypothetical protein
MIIIEIFDGPLCRPYHVRKLDGLLAIMRRGRVMTLDR